METFDLINNELGFFEVDNAVNGYYRLLFKNEPVVADSACEDLYDKDMAEAHFNDFIDEYAKIQGQKTLAKAFDEGYDYNSRIGFDENIQEAEMYLIEECEGTFEFCELGRSGYSYGDYVCSGEIFDFGHYTADKNVYFRENEDGTFTSVDWFEVPSPGEEGRNKFVFVFDTIVYDGEVLKLYDRFE